MCHSCERNVARRILLYFRTITVLEERRTATEREENDERKQRWHEYTIYISISTAEIPVLSIPKSHSNNLPADSMLQNREMNLSL